ncbi:FAD/NAD(P)-binding domain-containing protein [Wolfiporia cocos MD-104 SS10]|uniref:FAD/NAD(P)-binding domain-containing protein n=1 Tax=Wolfiporia cocos (strain MD-104) TaxID=742152 RepID=A0A2H3JGG3_WOLCO|nr:FAD/NAD(P)-binding domain-containing protein [Wolfiporia cocos MD-104 SS10]
MSSSTVPTRTQILVIGGGPAGSYAASLLQREGFQVTLLEAAKFPRYHIGESLLPPMRGYLRFIGLEEEFEKHGFIVKPGASFKLAQGLRESWTDFSAGGPDHLSWNVIRSEMDDMLLRHAAKQGVQVFDDTRVDSIAFEGDPASSRPISAKWSTKQGASGEIAFDWLVDASGRAGIMSTKYLKNRHMRESLRNVAVWGYWTGVKRNAVGTRKENSPWFEALTDQQGWSWAIPLHDGTTSIGVVMHQDASIAKKAKLNANGQKPTLTEHYMEQLEFLPGVKELIGDEGKFIPGSTKSAADFSYFATRYSGDHFRVIGDAANFVDPFFSSGVHIALTGATSAALTICASIKGEVSEELAQAWHDTKLGVAHTRFLFVILGAYKQMHLQDVPILSDISGDNFDFAFDMFRPVIFGLADASAQLTSEKVQQMMDVFERLFDPRVNEDTVSSVRARYGADVVSPLAPVLGQDGVAAVARGDADGERVMLRFEALKVFGQDFAALGMGLVPLLGYVARVQRGNMGLDKADARAPEVTAAAATAVAAPATFLNFTRILQRPSLVRRRSRHSNLEFGIVETQQSAGAP